MSCSRTQHLVLAPLSGLIQRTTNLFLARLYEVGVTYISWFSDFALYLEYYLLDKCHTGILLPCEMQTLFSWKNEKNISKCRLLKILPRVLSVMDPMNDHLLYLSHCDLYCMVQ